jgi:hypothetical protein
MRPNRLVPLHAPYVHKLDEELADAVGKTQMVVLRTHLKVY